MSILHRVGVMFSILHMFSKLCSSNQVMGEDVSASCFSSWGQNS